MALIIIMLCVCRRNVCFLIWPQKTPGNELVEIYLIRDLSKRSDTQFASDKEGLCRKEEGMQTILFTYSISAGYSVHCPVPIYCTPQTTTNYTTNPHKTERKKLKLYSSPDCELWFKFKFRWGAELSLDWKLTVIGRLLKSRQLIAII